MTTKLLFSVSYRRYSGVDCAGRAGDGRAASTPRQGGCGGGGVRDVLLVQSHSSYRIVSVKGKARLLPRYTRP